MKMIAQVPKTPSQFLVLLLVSLSSLFSSSSFSPSYVHCVEAYNDKSRDLNDAATTNMMTMMDMEVRPDDTILIPPPIKSNDPTVRRPQPNGRPDVPILGPIKGYNWRDQTWPDSQFELPIYKNLDRSQHDFWYYVLDELLLARVPVVFLHGRGCAFLEEQQLDDNIELSRTTTTTTTTTTNTAEEEEENNIDYDNPLYQGAGHHCPRLLKFFVDAMEDAGLFNETWSSNVLQIAMWDDTGAYPYNAQYGQPLPTDGSSLKLDIADPQNLKWFWEHNVELFFETIPSQLWYRIEDRPVIATWNARFFTNNQGNLSRLLLWISLRFQERFQTRPWFIIQEDWLRSDTTLANIPPGIILGVHSWMKPVSDNITSVYSYTEYNNETWGLVAPSFRNPRTEPGCGMECREVTRRNGTTLRTGLEEGIQQDAYLTLLESWTNMAESGGFYRSEDWTYPTEYINIVRNYTDPEPQTLLFQAEGADRFSDNSVGNGLFEYSTTNNTNVDIGRMPSGNGGGWYVGHITSGEWIEYQDVWLGCGTYRFTVKAATHENSMSIVRLDLGPDYVNSLPSRIIGSTGGLHNFELFHLGQVDLPKGKYNLRLWFESAGGGIRVDWFFMKQSNVCVT